MHVRAPSSAIRADEQDRIAAVIENRFDALLDAVQFAGAFRYALLKLTSVTTVLVIEFHVFDSGSGTGASISADRSAAR